jgi:predicted kinase
LHASAYNAETERMVWTLAHYMVKALFFAGHHIVILDATNTTRERRAEWKSPRWRRRYRLFRVSEEECLRRASETPHLLPIIGRMAQQFEEIEQEEWDDLYMSRSEAVQESP